MDSNKANGTDSDEEIGAISSTLAAVKGLPPESQKRVLIYVADRLGVGKVTSSRGMKTGADGDVAEHFTDFPSLYDGASPKTDPERALVAGYFYQVVQGNPDLDSQTLNTALKNLGHGITNITDALSSLKARKPALVMQTLKS